VEEPEAQETVEYVAATASEIPHLAQLEPEALELLEDGQSPQQFLERLVATERWSDALGFWARAIPVRIGIEWAHVCVQDALAEEHGDELDAGLRKVLDAVDAWLAEPDDEHRRAAFDVAQEVGLDSAPAILALAIFLSEGSMSPPDLEPVPAEEGLAHTALAGSVQLASVQFKPELLAERAQRFLGHGREVAVARAAAAAESAEPTSEGDEPPSWPESDLQSGYDLS